MSHPKKFEGHPNINLGSHTRYPFIPKRFNKGQFAVETEVMAESKYLFLWLAKVSHISDYVRSY